MSKKKSLHVNSEKFMYFANMSFLEKQNLLPKIRWRRSRWGRYCPVQLARGNLVQGKVEFSVG